MDEGEIVRRPLLENILSHLVNIEIPLNGYARGKEFSTTKIFQKVLKEGS